MGFTVLILVGPGAAELAALEDTLAGIRHFEPDARVVCVDDSPEPRSLPVDAVVRSPVAGRAVDRRTATTTGTVTGLAWGAGNGADPLLKMDTDAVLVAPVRDRIATDLVPGIGLVGRHRFDANGNRRVFHRWRRPMARAPLPVHVRRGRQGVYVRLTTPRRSARLVGLFVEARRHGYIAGEHCQGGSYAVSGEALVRMRSAGKLQDPLLFAGVNFSEDVAAALLVRSTGLRLADSDAFGVKVRGLPDAPERLVERGFAVVHAVKNDPDIPEAEIRARLRALRAGVGP